jgi:beta-1,4-N-acetylglucosaminyltransferase
MLSGTCALAVLCVGLTLLWIRIRSCLPSKGKTIQKGRPLSTFVVFGSGGHTSEMLQLLTALKTVKYDPCYFILANTDSTSENKIRSMPLSLLSGAKWLKIQRSREVKQSYISTVFTSLKSLMECFYWVATLQPDLIICNGPGTCVPLCYALFFLRVVGITQNSSIVFVESFCRVQSLSLTGKLLYYISDVFLVQWPLLAEKYPRAKYIGSIC